MYCTLFEIFGVVHLLTIAIVLLVSALLPKFYKNKSDSQKSTMTKIIIGVTFFLNFVSIQGSISIRESISLDGSFALHMCDLSEIFLVWFLLGGPRILYTCAFFWGLGGAIMAILTPTLVITIRLYLFHDWHGMIVVDHVRHYCAW